MYSVGALNWSPLNNSFFVGIHFLIPHLIHLNRPHPKSKVQKDAKRKMDLSYGERPHGTKCSNIFKSAIWVSFVCWQNDRLHAVRYISWSRMNRIPFRIRWWLDVMAKLNNGCRECHIVFCNCRRAAFHSHRTSISNVQRFSMYAVRKAVR